MTAFDTSVYLTVPESFANGIGQIIEEETGQGVEEIAAEDPRRILTFLRGSLEVATEDQLLRGVLIRYGKTVDTTLDGHEHAQLAIGEALNHAESGDGSTIVGVYSAAPGRQTRQARGVLMFTLFLK